MLHDIVCRCSKFRSAAHKIRHSIGQDSAQQTDSASEKIVPTTFLEMNFSDSEDTNDEVPTQQATVSGEPHMWSTTHMPDEDYFPTAADLEMIGRDLAYDRCEDDTLTADNEGDTYNNTCDDDVEDEFVDVASLRSGAVSPHEYFLRSRKGDLALTPGLSLDTSLWEEDEYRTYGQGQEINMIQFAPTQSNDSSVNTQADALSTQSIIEKLEEEKVPGRPEDPEEKIYSNFLRSLFSPAPHTSVSFLCHIFSLLVISISFAIMFFSCRSQLFLHKRN